MNDELEKRLAAMSTAAMGAANNSAAALVAAMGAELARPAISMPNLYVPSPPQLDDSDINPAKWMYRRLKKYIKSFEDNLDNDHEVGARLVSFGQSVTFHIADMGYYGPDIISFNGTDEKGQTVQLIQHTSQLSVLLIAMKKQSETPRRIGFILDEKDKNETDKTA